MWITARIEDHNLYLDHQEIAILTGRTIRTVRRYLTGWLNAPDVVLRVYYAPVRSDTPRNPNVLYHLDDVIYCLTKEEIFIRSDFYEEIKEYRKKLYPDYETPRGTATPFIVGNWQRKRDYMAKLKVIEQARRKRQEAPLDENIFEPLDLGLP